LWGHQEKTLDSYFANYLQAKDVAIEPPTGTGKTLVGLLIAEYRRRALENPQKTDFDRLVSLGKALAVFCRSLSSSGHAHLLALSNMLVQPVSEEETEGKEQPKVI
jgi:hypothetical protein